MLNIFIYHNVTKYIFLRNLSLHRYIYDEFADATFSTHTSTRSPVRTKLSDESYIYYLFLGIFEDIFFMGHIFN